VGVLVRIKVNPRSSRDEITDLESDPVRVKLTAPPVEGEANRALIQFVARSVRVPKRDVEVVSGEKSRHKTIRIRGRKLSEVIDCLLDAVR
jgi:uncharacterized protein (TIGR00251 family)